jgi:hypothetical protein
MPTKKTKRTKKKTAEISMPDHGHKPTQQAPHDAPTRHSNPGFQTLNVQETLKMDDSVGRLLDKQFQPAAMLLGGLITVVVFVASGLFWFDGTIKSKVRDTIQNEMTILHGRDDEIARSVNSHDERIKKLEIASNDIQQTLGIMKQVQADMREDIKDIKEFMRRNGSFSVKSRSER